ncbi:MAG: AEC family transporter [Pseudomonadota bacterium]
MIPVFLAIAPVFLLIMLGYGLRRGGIPSAEFWNLNDRLVYWVLMPALFFVKISQADLTSPELISLSAVLYGSFFAAVAIGLLLSLRWGAADGSSVMQGAARFNTFIALALAEALYGVPGLQIAVLGAAILVPIVNVTIVSLMSFRLGAGKGGILGELIRNPLILSIFAGVVFNLLGWNGVPVLHDVAGILGQAALPIMLMCVGANLKLRGLSAEGAPVLASMFGKFVVFPMIAVLLIYLMQPAQLTAEVCILFAALPVGVATYSLSREMGGNASLMATVITVQTVLSFLTLPFTVLLARMVLF